MLSYSNYNLVFAAHLIGCTFLFTTTTMAQDFVIDQRRSSVKYSASHPLHNWEASSFKTNGVIVLNLESPEHIKVTLSIPVESFDSQNSNRDSNMMDVVDVDRFPTVVFVLTEVMPNVYDGSDYNATWVVKGDLTFHGVTNQVETTVEIQQSGSTLQATGSFTISLEDFKIKRPSLMLMKMKDNLDFSFDLWATESN